MGELGERVRLIHELAQLGSAEEITHNGAQGLRIDQLLRRDVIDGRIVEGHALADKTLRAGESHAALVSKQFSNRTNTAAAEVIDIVEHPVSLAELEKITHGLNDIFLAKDAVIDLGIKAKLLLDLVTANATEVVAFGVKEETLEHASGILGCWRIAGTELAVNVLECLFLAVGRVALEGLDDRVVILGVDDLDRVVSGTDQIANDGGSQGLVGAGNDCVALADVGKQDLSTDFLLVELVRELQAFDLVEESCNLLVRREAKGT